MSAERFLVGDSIRGADRVFRVGGEEFLLLLDGCSVESAVARAETIRSELAALALIPDRPITLRGGVAQWLPGEPNDAWLRRADALLYAAKNGGRDQVVSQAQPSMVRR